MKQDLIGARARLAAVTLAAAGCLLTACVDEPTETVDSGITFCTVNCDAAVPPFGTPGSGGTAGIGLPGGPRPGATAGAGGTTGIAGIPAGGTTGVGAVPGGSGGTAGGTPGNTGGVAGGGGDLPCDVKKIVAQRCGACHGAMPVSAPMPLATLAQWQAPSPTDPTKKNFQVAKVRINATTRPMPPVDVLTPDEKAKLNAWLDQNAPAGTGGACTDIPTQPGEIDTTGLECYKMTAHAQGNKSAKYKVGAVTDAYINFGFQAPWRSTLYVQVIKPVIDNPKALHHWLLYKEAVQDGSITPTIGQHSGELLNGWAPGGDQSDLRKHGDVAMELPASTYSVEIHYNSSDPNAQDASGVEVCGKSTRPQHIASLSWLGYDQGGTIAYATGLCLEPSTSWTGTCNPGHSQPIHLLTLTPHLHQAGRHLKAVINGPNGQRILHDKPFNFEYQVTYDTNEVLMPGETITTNCSYSEPKCAGQSTTQEMCYLYTLHYPAQTLVDYGPEGTLMHGEGVCLGQ